MNLLILRCHSIWSEVKAINFYCSNFPIDGSVCKDVIEYFEKVKQLTSTVAFPYRWDCA